MAGDTGSRLGKLLLISSAALLAGSIALAQSAPGGHPAATVPAKPDQAPPSPGAAAASTDDAAAAMGPKAAAPGRRAGGGADAVRQFLGLGAAPDAIAAGRGKPIFAENCAACHGPDARGGIGPNLLYSSQLLDDDHGEKMVPFLKVGRPDKGMPPFAQLGDRALTDVTEFLHQQVENYANRGTYQNTNNVMTGDSAKGAAFFRKNCVECHSVTGDLKGVGAKFRPLDLQRSMIFPSREDHPGRAIRATVTTAAGSIEGRITKIDDFAIVLIDQKDIVHAFQRGPDVKVMLKDPLQWHKDFAFRIKDREMTDLVTYLGSLK
ncbi:c-type cytochrome [Sphingomonas crusticola]|uniref:c-type cytochrome n=1 Tax=Sphingomonas crusticola TaxID=1697973 RepID=UPI000E284AC3|nr:c-type cytochrome [Sphingomonas crusticola]